MRTRSGTLVGAALAAALSTGVVAATATTPVSARVVVGRAPQPAAAPAARQHTVQIWLTPRVGAAERFATAVATPGTPQFRHYLSPDAYAARFGPTTTHISAVTQWLESHGMRHVHPSAGHDYVSASGSTPTVRRLLGLGATRAISVPSALGPDVLGVTGLSGHADASATAAATGSAPNCSTYWAQHVHPVRPAYRGLTQAGLRSCGYSARQLRAAYGATWTSSGKGQTVALTELDEPTLMPRALAEYARRNHLPTPGAHQFREIRAQDSGSCSAAAAQPAASDTAQDSYDDESEMDSEAVYAMAPRADQLMVIGRGCDEDQALLNAVTTVLAGDGQRPSASIVSNSWAIPVGSVRASTLHAIDVRAVAEGVGLYFSSGDTTGLEATTADPYVTAVGGTTLGVGKHDARLFETGWSSVSASLDHGTWSESGGEAAGGGTSAEYRQPAYQRGVVPASLSTVHVGGRKVTGRAVPDIAADADVDTGMLTGYLSGSGKDTQYHTKPNAGTSLSCPLVAGLVADAQQGQQHPFGFINPLIYRLSRTHAIRDVLPVTSSMPARNRASYEPAPGGHPASIEVFDSQSHRFTDQVSAKGYDTMTGVGVPNGAAFLAGLRRLR